jgi:hypothetical protein
MKASYGYHGVSHASWTVNICEIELCLLLSPCCIHLFKLELGNKIKLFTNLKKKTK